MYVKILQIYNCYFLIIFFEFGNKKIVEGLLFFFHSELELKSFIYGRKKIMPHFKI
jgi:hypothetical protein